MSQTIVIPRVEFPAKLSPLFEHHAYKVLYGGRGGGKSWAIARALLLFGMKSVERILCLREVQHSIKESVHQLLEDQIDELELNYFYRVTDTYIRGANGTEFSFAGIMDHTADRVRSFEGATKVWVEEAQNVSKQSWKTLIPTIRTKNREFWISFNPDLETGEAWTRFVKNPRKDSVVIRMNWSDNPWFPQVLEDERLHDKATMEEEEYNNVWEGEPMRSVAGAIFGKEVARLYKEGRVTINPYDPRLKVHLAMDLGFEDLFAVGFFQRRLSELRCFKTRAYQHVLTSDIAGDLRKMNYNWGAVWLPHDGFAKVRQGQSDDQVFRSFGFRVGKVPDVSKAVGERYLRETLRNFWFHEPDTKDGLDGLKKYRRNERPDGVITAPVHDGASHWADMFRYAALSAPKFWNESDNDFQETPPHEQYDQFMGVLGV